MTRPVTARRGVSVRVDSDAPAAEHAEPAAEMAVLVPAVGGLTRQLSPVVVGSADDRQEHQADAVANRVVAALRRQRSRTPDAAPEPAAEPAVRSAEPLAALRRQADRSASLGQSAAIGRDGGRLSTDTAHHLNRARNGGVPLAADTRAAFEPAIGADLSPVRLHVGPQARVLNHQVGALAFTAGHDIFFRDGLPDVGTESGQHLLAHELAHAVTPEAGGPVRRAVVAQLHMDKKIDEDAARITAVSIVGRPPPTFSGSMGDHTTAFTVHVNAVQLALIGSPLSEAAARLQDLVDGLNLTPGSTLVSNLPDRQARMLREAHERLLAIRGRLHTPTEGLDVAAAIQDYVAAYLELRELVPLSTINTGSVSKATSGKGKGEDCAALRGQASGAPQHPDQLAAEVVGLLDVRAVALSCAETDAVKLAALAPGLPVSADATKRAALFVEQHLRSLQTAFPGALAALAEMRGFLAPASPAPPSTNPRATARARDDLAVPLLLPDLLHRVVLPRAVECLNEELPILLRNLISLQTEIESSRPVSIPSTPSTSHKRKREPLDSGKASKKGLQNLAKLESEELKLRAQVNAIEVVLNRKPTPAVGDDVSKRRTVTPSEGPRRSGRSSRPGSAYDPGAEVERAQKLMHERHLQAQMKALEAPAEEIDTDDLEEAAERQGALAIQVIVDDAGIVTAVRSAGRPPSPFAGSTMGAHTTAWTVHVDRIRQLVVGSSIDDALAAVQDLDVERTEMEKQLGPAFAFPEGTSLPGGAAGSSGDNHLLELQSAIITHLEAVNLVPGAALAAADVGGKSEGKHRRVLLEHLGLQHFEGKSVKHSKEQVLEAVVGLIDVGGLNNEVASDDDRFAEVVIDHDEDPLDRLVEQHLTAIEASYPGALAAAGLPTSMKAAVAKVVKETGKETGKEKKPKDSKDKKRPEKRFKPEAEPVLALESGSPWKPSLFGSSSSFLFEGDFEFTGSLLGGVGTMLPARSGDEPGEGDWLDAEGNLLDDQLPQFRDAYRADVALAGTYLAEAEGPVVADAFGIRVNVYRDRIPPGFTRVENVAGGDCLIHASSDIRAAMALEHGGIARAEIPVRLGPAGGRAVPGGEISRIRGLASAGVPAETVDNAVRDVVLSEVDGRGTPGLGPAMRLLIRNRRLQYTAAVVRGRRRREEAKKALEAHEAAKKERARIRAEERAGKKPGALGLTTSPSTTVPSKPGVVPPVRVPVVQAQLSYGTAGEISENYALLHTGGNHYVALVRTG